jgi:hypothetical protein
VQRLPNALRLLIGRTLDSNVRLSYTPGNGGGFDPPGGYGDLVHFISKRKQERNSRSFPTLITFNYNVALDFALHWNCIPVNYALGRPSVSGDAELLKLHGSLNWGKCHKCGEVIPFMLHEYFAQFHIRPRIGGPRTEVALDYPARLTHLKYCDENLGAAPLIVPPTWNKAAHYSQIRQLWRAAAERLATAEHIYVTGYSLPESDHFFRHLYALGTVGRTRLKRLCVINPDESGKTEARFRELLGPTALARFEYRPQRFEQCIGDLRSDQWD